MYLLASECHPSAEEVVRDYRLDSLKSYIELAKEDLIWLENHIQRLEKQKRIVEKTQFQKVVILKSHPYPIPYGTSEGFAVALHCIPQVKNKEAMFHDVVGPKVFCPGKRKEATAYAKALAEEHKAELIFK
jgi:hypothetical protein